VLSSPNVRGNDRLAHTGRGYAVIFEYSLTTNSYFLRTAFSHHEMPLHGANEILADHSFRKTPS
jgi:hypothetical protein